MTAGRDNTGVALWIGFAAGGLMAAAAYGDTQDLACLLDAGVILACGSAIALLSRWVSRGQVPGSTTAITEAPSVLRLAESNAGEIRELKARVGGILLLMHELTPADGLPGRLDEARQVSRSATILQFPLKGAKGSGDSQAGLCPAARAPLGLLCR